jgi:hypothetical protein
MSDNWKAVLFLWLALWLGAVFMDMDVRENRKDINMLKTQGAEIKHQVNTLNQWHAECQTLGVTK